MRAQAVRAVDAERTARESRYLAQVRSHRVARVVDSGTWQSRAYFVQEFIDGPTLADVLSRRAADR